MISAAAERMQCVLLGEACLAACSRGWVQHCGMILLLNVFLFVFSPNSEMLGLHREEEMFTVSFSLETVEVGSFRLCMMITSTEVYQG